MERIAKLFICILLCCAVTAGCSMSKSSESAASSETLASANQTQAVEASSEEYDFETETVKSKGEKADKKKTTVSSDSGDKTSKSSAATSAKSKKSTSKKSNKTTKSKSSKSKKSQSNSSKKKSTSSNSETKSAASAETAAQTEKSNDKATTAEAKKTTAKSTAATTTSSTLTCTIKIECSSILDNMDNLAAGHKEFVPSDGIILDTYELTMKSGSTVYDLLEKAADDNDIYLAAEKSAYGIYISGINNLDEKDCGLTSGWIYYVNGKFASISCSGKKLSNGDKVVFSYTCSYNK